MWLAEEADMAGPAYHIHAEFNVAGPLELDLLQRGIDAVVARHSVLRTTIVEVDGVPQQGIHEPAPLNVPIMDLTEEEADSASWPLCDLVAGFITRRWDLAHEWPIRIAVAVLPDGAFGIVFVVHHIAADADSLDILFEDFASLYVANRRNGGPPPVEDAPQYADIARRQQSRSAVLRLERKLERWRELLKGASDVINLPLDRPRTQQPDGAGGVVTVQINDAVAARLRRLAAGHRTTMFVVILVGFAMTLEAFGADADMLIATPSQQRDDETRGVVGCLVNPIPLRVRVPGTATARDLILQARTTALTALELRDVPFDALIHVMKARRTVGMQPLTQVSVRMGTTPTSRIDLDGTVLSRVNHGGADAVKYDLSLAIEQGDGDALGASLEYRKQLFDRETAERFAASLESILKQLADDHSLCVRQYRTMPAREMRMVLEQWNPACCTVDLPGVRWPARCYVLDQHGRPRPVSVPGELVISGMGELPDPFAGMAGALMKRTGITAWWTSAGELHIFDGKNGKVSSAPGDPESPPGDCDPAVLREVREIWCTLFRLDEVSESDDFFDLGGDSLLAMRLISRLRRSFHARLTLREVLLAATPARQACIVSARRLL